MDKLLPIGSVQREDVLNVVRQALRAGLDADALEDFLASVDWSGTDRQRPPIADLLGQMEGWGSQYADRAFSQAQYVGHLLSLLPEEERERHLVTGGGLVTITVSLARQVHQNLERSLQGQSFPLPQTGSGAPPALAEGKLENRTVPVA
jgi:hypothetical protein